MKLEAVPMVLAATAMVLVFGCTKTEMYEISVDDEDTGQIEALDDADDCYEPGIANIYLSEELADTVEANLAEGGYLVFPHLKRWANFILRSA